MNKSETQKILLILLGAYPSLKPDDMNVTVNVWNKMLEQYDYKTVEQAVISYVTTNKSGFPPTIAHIIEEIQQLKGGINAMSGNEAWALVTKAIRNSTYNSIEEFNKLPTDIKRAVGRPEQLYYWATDEHYNESVVSSNFLKSYKYVTEQQNKMASLPQHLRALVDEQKMEQKLIGIDDS